MFSSSILAFLWFMCKGGSAEAVHQKQQPEQRARLVHPASPPATVIHRFLLDLNEAESNNEPRPPELCSSLQSLRKLLGLHHTEFCYLPHHIKCYSQYYTKEVVKKIKACVGNHRDFPKDGYFRDLHSYTEQLWNVSFMLVGLGEWRFFCETAPEQRSETRGHSLLSLAAGLGRLWKRSAWESESDLLDRFVFCWWSFRVTRIITFTVSIAVGVHIYSGTWFLPRLEWEAAGFKLVYITLHWSNSF